MKTQILRNISLGLLSVLLVFSAVYGFSGWQGVENATTGETLTATHWNNFVTGIVKKTGDVAETITGIKTFSVSPIVPSPTASGEVASKGYVDSTGNQGGENYIINGNFDIWQRGTSTTTNGVYLADRWITYNGDGARTVSRQSFSLGQSSVPYNPKYYLRHNQTSSASSSGPSIHQRIEGVGNFSGENATISFWAKASTSISVIPKMTQNFGNGGSPSGEVENVGANISIGTSRAKHSVTIPIASVAGKSLGTNSNDFIALILGLPLGSTYIFDLAQVQVENGTGVSNFKYRSPGEELSLAQRYYSINTWYFGWSSTNHQHTVRNVTFPVTMRTTPTIVNSIGYIVGAPGVTIFGVSNDKTAIHAAIPISSNGESSGSLTADAEL